MLIYIYTVNFTVVRVLVCARSSESFECVLGFFSAYHEFYDGEDDDDLHSTVAVRVLNRKLRLSTTIHTPSSTINVFEWFLCLWISLSFLCCHWHVNNNTFFLIEFNGGYFVEMFVFSFSLNRLFFCVKFFRLSKPTLDEWCSFDSLCHINHRIFQVEFFASVFIFFSVQFILSCEIGINLFSFIEWRRRRNDVFWKFLSVTIYFYSKRQIIKTPFALISCVRVFFRMYTIDQTIELYEKKAQTIEMWTFIIRCTILNIKICINICKQQTHITQSVYDRCSKIDRKHKIRGFWSTLFLGPNIRDGEKISLHLLLGQKWQLRLFFPRRSSLFDTYLQKNQPTTMIDWFFYLALSAFIAVAVCFKPSSQL